MDRKARKGVKTSSSYAAQKERDTRSLSPFHSFSTTFHSFSQKAIGRRTIPLRLGLRFGLLN